MGSLLFVILWGLGYRDIANDYQILPLLVSLDSIAIATYLQFRCRKRNSSED